MSVSAKDRAAANAERRAEYATIRERLASIATADPAEDITARDRVEAAKLLYQIDTNGAPPVYRW